jgi:drug/metabolite transporter (DMT)-like permease
VQPALASGLLILLFIGSRMFDEHVGWVEIAGVVAIIAGVTLVAWGAPAHTEAHRTGAAVIAVVGALTLAGLVPFFVRGTRWDTGMGAIIASGAGFAASNVATKLLSDDIGSGHYLIAAGWAAAGLISGVAATITGMTAFQRRPATTVVPVSTAVQTFLPIVLEPFFLREPWSTAKYAGVPIAAGMLVALAGTVIISRTRAVSELSAAVQR